MILQRTGLLILHTSTSLFQLKFDQRRWRRLRLWAIVFLVAVFSSRSAYQFSHYKNRFVVTLTPPSLMSVGDSVSYDSYKYKYNYSDHWSQTRSSTKTTSSRQPNLVDTQNPTTTLRRFRERILHQKPHQPPPLAGEWENDEFLFDNPHLAHILTPESVCAFGPGQGMEEDAGYKLLVEKIRTSRLVPPVSHAPLLFCGIYSYSGKRTQVQVQAATWGHQCDGWMVFSNETVPGWGIFNLSHVGPESYANMWQKVRSVWNYVYREYYHLFDYFYLGGDDVYVLVDNLRQLLAEQMDSNIPQHLGQWLPGRDMVAGGPGYLLNKLALQRLILEGLPNCSPTTAASYEDRLISRCLASLQILGNRTDTRDERGEQRFHDASPAMLYTFRAGDGRGSSYLARMAMAWEDLPHPSSSTIGSGRVGPKYGLAAAATHSISFHNIHNPLYMARVHAILFPASGCPRESPLGRGLLQLGGILLLPE